METKYGFTKLTIDEFESWLKNLRVARTVLTIQQHHTYSPNYSSLKNSNHFELQRGMKNYHVNKNGWADIGQQFSTFPDGTILTGRSMELSPACIYGANSNSVCIEHVGDFDKGKDQMTAEHKETIIRMTAALCAKFNLKVSSNSILYHHWFDLGNGTRNNGTKNNKSCPGTNFFGGNKVQDCEKHFLPLINKYLKKNEIISPISTDTILKYVCVTTSVLNIRKKPNSSSEKSTDREAATLGAILRVYKEKNGWYKISSSKEHWVFAKYCQDVSRATVNATQLNARKGPGTSFPVVGSYKKGQELFIVHEENGWCEINMDDKWVSKSYLKI